jgi:hypothetical protein
MIVLIVITQLNLKLASDYFSVTKIFSVRKVKKPRPIPESPAVSIFYSTSIAA